MNRIPAEHIRASVAWIRERMPGTPDVALVLGSGLGDYADGLPGRTSLPTADIPHYPVSTVEGHRGALVFAELGGKKLLAFQGRIHLYECNDLTMVLYPILVAAGLGVRALVVTNAAGGINRQFAPGDLMLITDQIDLMFERLPAGVPSARHTRLYDETLTGRAEELARKRGIPVRRGVYAGVKGPSYETAAEVEMIHRLGGDAVGMSTVKEVLCASELGMTVLGISCITNKATGIGSAPLDHAEVRDVAGRVRRDFALLLTDIIQALGQVSMNSR
jgi:purine-nucleoside phosphorylase